MAGSRASWPRVSRRRPAGHFQHAQVVGRLPPAGQPVPVGQLGTQPQRLADGRVEQAGIGGVFDIRLYHERVSAGVEPVLRAFF
jgi:hypothetical protein